MTNPKVALQLFTLRDYDKDDFSTKLRKVSEAGYDGVEFAGFADVPAEEMRAILDENNLVAMGSHTNVDELLNDFDGVIAYNKVIGTSYIIIPYYKMESIEDKDRLVSIVKDIGPKIQAAGMNLLYHNHYHELNHDLGDKTILEMLKEEANEGELNFEIDMFWTTHADHNPAELLNDFGTRCKTVHLKDMVDKEEKTMTEVGTGILDLQAILSTCKSAGFGWVVVEQDRITMDGYDSIKISLQNVKNVMKELQ